MAPAQIVEPVISTDKMSPTQENKPPIPTGAGAKKAMEAYFAGNNHMEFRQRSSSSSRTTRTFSRGATPSRDAAANAKTGASGGSAVPEGAIDPDALKNALKKIPSVEKNAIRPTPPRSRSISRSHSPLPDEELLDETLPDFYKVTLKPTERTGSQTRDILLGGNRLSRGATPTGNGDVPEFRRVALRRTPSREQLTDEQVHKRSTLKKNTVMEASSSTTSPSRSSSFTSLTAINKTVHSKRNSTTEDKPEFKGFVLKKTGSRPGSRSGSPTKTGSRTELSEGAGSLRKVETSSSRSASRRGSGASESAEFANVSLKKTQMVKGDQSKFQVEQVSLKPIPVGEGEEEKNSASAATEGWRAERASSVTRQRQERASSVSRQRVLRETKFEANDEEYLDIKSSLDKLKKREATPTRAESPKKEATPTEDAAAKPLVYRRGKKLPHEEEEMEKVTLKPVVRKAAEKAEEKEKVQLKPIPQTFSSSIECIKKAVDEEEEEKAKSRPLLRKMSFTSSLDNIAVGSEEKEKVHLSCFSKEMGSNVDLVQVCQEQGDGKHEVKLEFELGGNQMNEVKEETNEETKVKDEAVEKMEASCQQAKEAIEQRLTANITVDDETGEKEEKEEESEEEEEEIREEVVTLHKIRKAPSIDGLFQRQDVQAAFTFTLPFQNEQPTTKLSLEIPNIS